MGTEERQFMTKGEVEIKAGREKYWEECTVDERLERMRRIVKTQGQLIHDLVERVRKLEQHSHDAIGRLHVPYEHQEYKENMGYVGRRPDWEKGVYF